MAEVDDKDWITISSPVYLIFYPLKSFHHGSCNCEMCKNDTYDYKRGK